VKTEADIQAADLAVVDTTTIPPCGWIAEQSIRHGAQYKGMIWFLPTEEVKFANKEVVQLATEVLTKAVEYLHQRC
jgi:hypothetical protein